MSDTTFTDGVASGGAATATNTSYLATTTELYDYVEERYVLQLITEADGDVPASPDTTHLNRLTRAMNWGREQIDAILRNVYSLQWTSATAPEIVKRWNAMLAVASLEGRRLTLGQAGSVNKESVLEEIRDAARPGGTSILSGGKDDQSAGASGEMEPDEGFQVDQSGQFDNIDQNRDSMLYPW